MGICYKNLDEETRKFMLIELERDIEHNKIYISPRLNSLGQYKWVELLKGEGAIQRYNDDWIAKQLIISEYMKSQETRRTQTGKIITAKIPKNGSKALSEGEFNRYYARGVYARAIDEEIEEVIVYRGKKVHQPRLESQLKIGLEINANELLKDLRTAQGVEAALGIPPGPNSGLTIRLP
jgi:hypothetical protein